MSQRSIRSVLTVFAVAIVSTVSAFAQSSVVHLAMASPASITWEAAQAVGSGKGKLFVVTLDEPDRRQSCHIKSFTVEKLICSRAMGGLRVYLPEQIAAMSDSPAGFLLVVEAGGAVCATALLTICPDAMYGDQPFGVIENTVVTEAMRGRGLGRILLEAIEQLAIAHRCTKLMLLSGATREAAHAFFRRNGFASDAKRAFVKYRRQFTGQ